jgi:non-specific serine/threonine protein kinase
VSLDDTVAYALGTRPGPSTSDAEPAGRTLPLTRRESQVAELIAQGLSNRQIATQLFIPQRTVESHTENILRKLGLTSRAQVTRWVANTR